jgi:hypothetical protein
VTFTDREAALEPVGSLADLPGVTSVVAERGHAFVGHTTGVAVVDLADPEHPQVLAEIDTGGLVQEVASCGAGRLCVAQTWGQGDLVVIDVAAPSAPSIVASLSLSGLCRSLGVRPGTAYVGCGAAGIHVVALDAPSGPVRVDTLWPGGPVSEVKVTDRLLVAGLYGKRVRVYRLGGASGPSLLAEKKTLHHPVQVIVSGTAIHVSEAKGLPWALCVAGIHCGVGHEVEVLELDEQAGSLDTCRGRSNTPPSGRQKCPRGPGRCDGAQGAENTRTGCGAVVARLNPGASTVVACLLRGRRWRGVAARRYAYCWLEV